MMRLLVVHPGASWSTADVYDGFTAALRRQGHTVIAYALNVRIGRAASWLDYNYRRARRVDPSIPRPTPADVLYQAGVDLIEKALRFLPDYVLVVSGMFLHPDTLILLRRAGLRIGLMLTESPYDDDRQAKILPLVDLAWTNERTSVPYLRQANPNVHYLPHAYAPDRHRPDLPVDESVPAHDVVFVGTGFPERVALLSAVDFTGIDLGLYGAWQMLPSRHRLRQYVRGGVVTNASAVRLYRRAKIGLNLYRESARQAESLNPRAVELAACGVFQISQYRAEVEEVFGGLVPTFRTPEELSSLLHWFLREDTARKEIARMLPARVAGRTFDAMAARVVADLEALSPAVRVR